MSKAKMEAAKELIQEKQYEQARAILETIDDPTAKKWLEKLDQMSPKMDNRKSTAVNVGKLEVQIEKLNAEIESRAGQRRSATIVFIFSLILAPIGIGVVLLPFSLINYFRHKNAVNRLQGEKEKLMERLAQARAELY